MKKVIRIILKWFLRILAGILSLILLIVVVFYLFRGKITDKALTYINKSQPGEVRLGTLNLRPFLNFPDVSVQLKDLEYFVGEDEAGTVDTIPILRLKEVYVSLDIIKLIKKSYDVSMVRFGDGVVNYIVGEDSVSNIEKALGIRFGATDSSDTSDTDSSALALDLESLQIRNLAINYYDIPGKINVSARLNGLESGFSYYPDTITAALMLHMNINSARVNNVEIDKPRTMSFSSSLIFDQINQKITLDRTLLDLKDAIFEAQGEVSLAESTVDLNFSAKNNGIELLNFLLNGILNLDDIEQIGDGQIQIKGKASGSFAEGIPRVDLNFSASKVGFLIHDINQAVQDISFEGYATNGNKQDLSEASIKIDQFHVSFPDGNLDANINLTNLVDPYAMIEISGDAELAVLEQILKIEEVKNMQGKLKFDGHIDGKIDRLTGGFLDNAGKVTVNMENVRLSLPDNEIERLNGELQIQDNRLTLRNMDVRVDGNDLKFDAYTKNLVPYFMGYNADPFVRILFSADELALEKIIGDTLFSGPIRNLAFRLDIETTADELKKALELNKVPSLLLSLQNFRAKVPGYSPISNLRLEMEADENDITISMLKARVGETNLDFEGQVRNYGAYLNNDSLAMLGLSFNIGSPMLRFKDLLMINDEFIGLPTTFTDEKMEKFRFKGHVETSVGELLDSKDLPNFKFVSDELHWNFKLYPMSFRDFNMNIEHRDSLILINKFRGKVGESNLDLEASLANLLDSTKLISGKLNIKSDLLDINELMSYELISGSGDQPEEAVKDTLASASPGFEGIDFPDLDLSIDVKALRYEGNKLNGMKGELRVRPYKIIYFDNFAVQTETGGSIVLEGQFNVSDPDLYMLSTTIDIDTVNITDFNVQIAMEDSIYSLEDNFNGKLSTNGIAELFLNPDFSISIENSTAMFSLRLVDGRVKNFTPLHALAKFTGNKDLDNVKFGLLRNSFTLINGAVQIPLMSIESNLGLILLEGEQKLDGDFLYLARVPVKLIRGTAWNVVSNQQRKESEEAEVQKMQAQTFLMVTISGKNGQEDVKIGDKRDKF